MNWIAFALLAAFFSAAVAVLEKKTLKKEHAMEFAAVLALCNCILTLPLIFVADFSKVTSHAVLIIYVISFLAAIAFLLVAKSLRHLDISITSPLLLLGPGVTALTAFVLLGETITSLQSIGIGFLIVGSYILQTHPHERMSTPLITFFKSKYVHFIIFSLLLYSFTAVGDRYILHELGTNIQAYFILLHAFIALNFFILISLFHDGFKGIEHGFKTAGWWIVAASALTLSYRYTYSIAVTLASVGLVVAVKRLSSLLSTLIGGELFHEKNLLRKSFACVVMLVGVVCIVM